MSGVNSRTKLWQKLLVCACGHTKGSSAPLSKPRGKCWDAAMIDATKMWMCGKQPNCLSNGRRPSEELVDAVMLTGLFSLYGIE